MQDVMLDLEAMSKDDPNAAIVSIGAVAFDRAKQVIGDHFFAVVDLQSSLDSGGRVDGDTIMWWMQQSDGARQALLADSVPLEEALTQFEEWLHRQGDPDRIRVWGNGVDYDNVVLRNAYRRLGRAAPWHFRNQKCYRSLKTEAPQVMYVPVGTLHNAVDDAMAQVYHLFLIDAALGPQKVLAELERHFPELATDEPLDGSDAVQWLCDWRERLRKDVDRARNPEDLGGAE